MIIKKEKKIFHMLLLAHFIWNHLWMPWILACIHVLLGLIQIEALAAPNSLSVQFSHSVVSDSLRPHESQHARPPCPSPTPGVHSDSRPSGQWCHPTISSSVVPFSSCPQSLPASESFPMSQFFIWGGQSTGVSASASFPAKKSQGWSPSEWTGWISLQSKGLSRVFSNTTVQKHQFFGTQPANFHHLQLLPNIWSSPPQNLYFETEILINSHSLDYVNWKTHQPITTPNYLKSLYRKKVQKNGRSEQWQSTG